MSHSLWVFIFGILGNVTSFVVFLAPVPTFYRIIKKKSTEGFQSVPYVVALFSATMWLYYAYLKGGEMLLITINSFGCVIEIVYIALYIAYAAKQSKVFTLKLLFLLNFGGFCILLALSHFLPNGAIRVKVLGGICVAFSVSVFAAPLSIIRVVIRTKSVEFMPFPLSFFLTITAVTWLLYGLCLKDFYVALPNVLGFIFGVVQMTLYQYYKNCRKNNKEKLPEQKADINIVDAEKFETSQVQIVCTEIVTDNNKDDQNGTVEQSNKLTAEQQKNIEEIIITSTTTSTEDHKGMENFIKAAQPATVKCEA